MIGFFRRFQPAVLDRYIFLEILQPFLTALLFWTSLFVAMVLKDVIGDLLGKGISLLDIGRFLVYLVGEKITLTIPMACLFAGILAAGRLSGDSEITAMRAAGISFPRIYSVFLFAGLLAALAVAAMNLYLGPMAATAREKFETWLKSYHSLSLARPGQFLGGGDIDGLQKGGQDIYALSRDGSVLQGIQIRFWDYKLDDQKSEIAQINGVPVRIGEATVTRVIQAEKGRLFTRLKDPNNLNNGTEKFLRMEKGYMLETDSAFGKIEVTDFTDGYMDYVLPPPKSTFGKIDVRPENYTFPELFQFLSDLKGGKMKMDFGEEGVSFSEEGKRLPSPPEMKLMAQQMRAWVLMNFSKVGQPGGPTAEEMQQKIQMILMFEGFLGDVDRTQRRFEIEIQKRIAVPIASLLFFYVSFPLGLVVKRSGKGMSFALALFVFFFYYLLLTYGIGQANAGKLPAVAGAWMADVGVLILGLYIMATRTEGFTPFQFVTAPVRKLFRRFVRPVLGRLIDLLVRWVPEPIRHSARVRLDRFALLWRALSEKIAAGIQKRLEKYAIWRR
ncbi:LptF/LptG family permease [Leptonema illini]|uniref:Permease YjgP/YjgQ family protein n=1 Tax=Leptonema illini DSM 21528 TaxID=929563 RepID=H2CF66_9LEPT|nr:LptF/LptG family permease [Leptonema illini]EHQ06694.1 permease YjgP/YjgQ family protein [Leptonema illini DSM 21528]